MADTEFSSVEWWMSWNGHSMLLGTTNGEKITADTLNEFGYSNWLGGMKREDVDRDKDASDDDSGLPNWTIKLYRVGDAPVVGGPTTAMVVADDLYATTVTDGDGDYSFRDVPPGQYRVEENMIPGWEQMLAPAGTFSVKDGTEKGGLDFLNAHTRITKTFELTFEDAPAGMSFKVDYAGSVGGSGVNGSIDLVDQGDGTFSADMPVAYGTTFSSFAWIANETGWSPVVLGNTDGETLTADKTNEFTYDGSASGSKFNDLNGNGAWDTLEPGLPDWEITLYRAAPVLDFLVSDVIAQPLSTWVVYRTTHTGAGGAYSFDGLVPGMYRVEETLKDGWQQTKDSGTPFTVGNDAPVTGLDFGNREEITKTFELTYAGAPLGTTFGVDYTIGSDTKSLALSGDGSTFKATEDLMAVTTIDSWTWYANYLGEKVTLGTDAPEGGELLSVDATNTFTYDGQLSGHKFNDVDGDGTWDATEPPLAEWNILLFRKAPQQLNAAGSVTTPTVPAGYSYYAQTTTAPDGSYSFTGVLPGQYYVVEGVQTGWTRTVSPEGPITVADGTSIEKLDFGNWVPFVPFTAPDMGIEKSASPTVAHPGDEIVYTLRYFNDGKGSATNVVVVDDYDETKMEVVNASGGTDAAGKITWHIPGPLAPGASGTIKYTMRVKDGVAAGTLIDNTAKVFIEGVPDDTMADNSDLAQIRVPGDPFLPFTGADMTLLLVAAAVLALAGLALRRFARVRA
jgi:uncharacterized repeat protein (TIGR01451 family)